ncbi:MAG: dihydrofolate reductase family protein [Actinomycetota bacterium]
MTTVIAGMTVSLDGFVADVDGGPDRLYVDLADLGETGYMRSMIEETGAVIMGRRTFEMGDPDSYVGNYEFQVPIFVVTSRPPFVQPKQDEHLTFTFVTDGVASAVEKAKVAAGTRSVTVVGGAGLIRELLRTGAVDELRCDVMPVLLGDGMRLFDDPSLAGIELVKVGVREVGARTSLRYRVVHS